MDISNILRTARIASWFFRILSTIVGLISIRIINGAIGAEGYGQIAFFLAVLTGVTALDFGFLAALPRFVARYESPQLSSRRAIFWASCLAACGILFFFQVSLIIGLAIPFRFVEQLQHLDLSILFEIGIVMVIGNLFSATSAIYAGFQFYGWATSAKIIRAIAYLICILLLSVTKTLTVESVLWVYTLTQLVANTVTGLWLLVRYKSRITGTWNDFPQAHKRELSEMIDYSLRGWLFTLSSILISSGTIAIAGLSLPITDIVKLQLSLTLYTGVTVFITGSMTPLTTIVARNSDNSPEAQARISRTITKLINETVIFAGALLIFFIHFGPEVIASLLHVEVSDRPIVTETYYVLLGFAVPGLLSLPFFTFRFALVSNEHNKSYNLRVFFGTLTLLVLGTVITVGGKVLMALALSASLALVWRSLAAYWMGKHMSPGISMFRIFFLISIVTLICEAFFLAISQLNIQLPVLSQVYIHGLIYGLACALLYLLKDKLGSVLTVCRPLIEKFKNTDKI